MGLTRARGLQNHQGQGGFGERLFLGERAEPGGRPDVICPFSPFSPFLGEMAKKKKKKAECGCCGMHCW